MRLEETAAVTGEIEYRIYRCGVEIEHTREHNLVVNVGRNRLAQLVAGKSGSGVGYLGVGTGSTIARLTDTYLTDQLLVPILSSSVSDADAVFSWELTTAQGNGLEIVEFGLFTADRLMMTRQVRGKVIGKDADMRIEGTYTLHF